MPTLLGLGVFEGITTEVHSHKKEQKNKKYEQVKKKKEKMFSTQYSSSIGTCFNCTSTSNKTEIVKEVRKKYK